MQTKQSSSQATPDTIRQEALQAVERALRKIAKREDVQAELLAIGQRLESLPLPTGEFALADNRLRNARRYLRSSEAGAARYELRLLAASLRNGESTRTGPDRAVKSRRA